MFEREPIHHRIDALPSSGVTVSTLRALDFVVPGEWTNDTDFSALIERQTGISDPDAIDRIAERAIELSVDRGERYHQALTVFDVVDRVDQAIAAAAVANKIGQRFSFLSVLEKVTPKADTAQAVDAGLKLVAEVVAFFLLNGTPKMGNISAFTSALAAYGRADIMRLAAWVVIDGLLPLGPDFMSKIVSSVGDMSTNNRLFGALSAHLPGDSAEEKKGFISSALSASADWINGFVQQRGLTQEGVAQQLQGAVDIAGGGMDYLAAALDASTNYFQHTGVQTVARVLVERAHREVAAELEERKSRRETRRRRRRRGVSVDDKTRRKALLAAGCLAACADGEISEDEIDGIIEALVSVPGIRARDAEKLARRLDKTIRRIDKRGFDTVMEEVREALVDRADREEAFTIAATVRHADGEVSEDEDEFLTDFADLLGISDEQLDAVLEEEDDEEAWEDEWDEEDEDSW